MKFIWKTPISVDFENEPLTDQKISEAESTIGIKLPEEYIAILKQQNGGYIRCRLSDLQHDKVMGIGTKPFSLLTDNWLSEFQDRVTFDLTNLIRFDGDGHWNLCLDYRDSKEAPKVTYVNTESDYNEVIAGSFSEYLEQLVIQEEPDTFVISFSNDASVLYDLVEKEFGLKRESGGFYIGYSTYSASANKGMDSIYIAPNLVPKYRLERSRKQELDEDNIEKRLRYPELEKDAFLVYLSESMVDLFVAFSEANDFSIERIENLIDCEILEEEI